MSTTLQHLDSAVDSIARLYALLCRKDAETIDRIMPHDCAAGLEKSIALFLKHAEAQL